MTRKTLARLLARAPAGAALMKAAAEAIIEIARDPKYVGATVECARRERSRVDHVVGVELATARRS